MAYFNHAFCKNFIAAAAVNANGTATSALTRGQLAIVDSGDWESLAAGSISGATGLLHIVQGSLRTNDNIGNNPGHGGYAESVKSKGINLKYISRLASSKVIPAANSLATLSVGSDCAPCGENFFVRVDVKGSPALRFLNHNAYAIGDSSGDAAANGGSLPAYLCCTVDGQTHVDPAVALAAAMQMVLADPITAPFIQESTANGVVGTVGAGTTAGALTAGTYSGVAVTATSGSGSFTGAQLDIVVTATDASATIVAGSFALGGFAVGDTITVAGNTIGGATPADDMVFSVTALAAASMKVQDGAAAPSFYSVAEVLDSAIFTASTDPVGISRTAEITIEGAYVDTKFGNCSFDTRDFYEKEPVKVILSVLDETGNPCNDCGVSTSTPGQMPNTLGEKVLRDLILTDRYMQMPYNQGTADSARIREIEGSADTVDAVTRGALYKVYYLQHSVPRFNNPSGVFDNDQYLYQIYVKSDDAATILTMDTLWGQISTDSGVAFDQNI